LESRQAFLGVLDLGNAGVGVLPEVEEFLVMLPCLYLIPLLLGDLPYIIDNKNLVFGCASRGGVFDSTFPSIIEGNGKSRLKKRRRDLRKIVLVVLTL
jgi:hypothetical protein